MNRTKVICLGSLLLGYYTISSFFPFETPIFTKGSLILGLIYPFIDKKLRVTITMIYQAKIWYTILNILTVASPTITSAFNYAMSSLIEPQTGLITYNIPSEPLHNIYLFLMVNPQILTALKTLDIMLSTILVNLAVLCVLLEILYFLMFFTQPYSTYMIYDKLGLFKLIERHTGSRITISSITSRTEALK